MRNHPYVFELIGLLAISILATIFFFDEIVSSVVARHVPGFVAFFGALGIASALDGIGGFGRNIAFAIAPIRDSRPFENYRKSIANVYFYSACMAIGIVSFGMFMFMLAMVRN